MFRSACQGLRMFVPVRHIKAEGTRVPDLHEPKYLEDLKPKVGYYEFLNLQLKAYDFVVLEKYQSYMHKIIEKLKIKTTNAWATPHQEIQVQILVDKSNAIEMSYNLKVYERNIQMKNTLITKLPVLIDFLHSTLPPGVTFSIDRHSQTDEDRLYFKDSVLENLKKELQELKDTPLIGA